MGKIRVYQVAKELGIENSEFVSRVVAMGIDVRNYMSSLEPEDVTRVKRAFDKQRHDAMVEEEIKPGVTRRRSARPALQTAQRKPQQSPPPEPPAAEERVAPQPPVKRKAAPRTRRGAAVP